MNRVPTWREILVTAQGDGTALTAAARATALPVQAKGVLDPGFFQYAGRMLHVWAAGRISTVITTPGTARFDVDFGGTVVFDSQAVLLDAVAAHTNVSWELDIVLTCRTVGTNANLMGVGKFISEVVKGSGVMPLGSLVAMLPWNAAPAVGANFSSIVSQTVDLFFTQTVATGSMTLHQYCLEAMN
jgi:hypothetical protein